MTYEQMQKELEQLASKSGIAVRYEKGDFDGGYCVLKDERLIIVNKKLAPQRKSVILAHGVAEIGIVEEHLKPQIRQFIEDELARSEKG